jgi:endogenous inhibitor of DNA gyrase (YacG/DUF329 family)
MERKTIRYVNGYRVIYLPDHPKAMKSKNWNGWVYEHVVIAEEQLKRSLRPEEVVHHLDFDRSNNRSTNLLVIERGQHAKLHMWLESGAPGWQQPGENRVNSKNPKSVYCSYCDKQLQRDQEKFCSKQCAKISNRKVIRPDSSTLQQDLSVMTWEAVGHKYGVSSNSVRKWAKNYKIDKATLSQAEDTSSEGAETTGEVQSS